MGKVFQLLNKLKNHLPACHVAACRALLLAQEGKIQPIFLQFRILLRYFTGILHFTVVVFSSSIFLFLASSFAGLIIQNDHYLFSSLCLNQTLSKPPFWLAAPHKQSWTARSSVPANSQLSMTSHRARNTQKNGLIILHIMPCLVGKSTVTPSMWHKITKLFRPIKGFEDYPKSDVDLNTAPIIISPQTAPVFHAVSPLLSSPAPASVCSSFSRAACPGASVMVPACRAAQEKWQSRESASDL